MESRAFIGRDGEEVTEGQAGLVPWWSFTKTVLAIALLRLAEVGRIDLDACVDGKVYTPAQLLRHEAGLPDYGPLAAYHADVDAKREPWSEEKLRAAVQADVPLYPPGRGWSYSNVGYLEVARLIERSSNQPLSDALNHWVFSKAGLNTARLASGPEDLRDVLMGDVEGYHPGWVYHGLVVGTAVEAARLLRALFRGELLAATSFSRMIEAVSLPQHRTSRDPDPGYGMGLMLSASRPLQAPAGHSGGGPGSRIAVYTLEGRASCVWCSVSSGIDPESEAFAALSSD